MLGQISSTIITAVAIIIITRFLGSTEYGHVAISYIPISIASLFVDLGVNGALVKYLAQYCAENRIGEASALLKTGLVINILVGSILTILIFISSGYLSESVFKLPEVQILLQISSINLLAQSLFNTARSVFIGYERMELLSIIILIQSLLRSFVAPILVYFGYGAIGAVSGLTLSIIVSGVIGILLIRRATELPKDKEIAQPSFVEMSIIIFSYGAPLFLSLLLSGSIGQIYNFLMALHVIPSDVGNYQVAINFTVLVSFFTMPISTVLFPLFSKIPYTTDGRLASVYQNSVKYLALITVPLTTGLILLSNPIVSIVYGGTYAQTPRYLQLVCIPFLLVGVGAQINDNLLNGLGKTRAFLMSNILIFVVGLPLSLYLIPRAGVIGLLTTTILAQLVGLLFTTLWINRNLNFSIDWGSSAKIYLSSIVPFALIFQTFTRVILPNWTHLFFGGILFLILYVALILATKVLTTKDLENLRPILSSMGPLTPIFNLILDISEKMITRNDDKRED